MDKKTITREELQEKAMIDAMQEYKPAEKFYKSPEWKKLRKSYLIQHPLCELCLQEGTQTPSSIVHHITPIGQGGSPFSDDNLIALCKDCHKDVHRYGPGIVLSIDMLSPDFWKQYENYSRWLPKSPFMYVGKTGKTEVAGASEKNADGTDRQKIIQQCRKGERLKLIRDPSNRDDSDYIGVFRESGDQIGHIDGKVAWYSNLAFYMDHGVEIEAKLLEITGEAGNVECIIGIKRGEMDWETYDKAREEQKKEKKKLRKKQTRAENAISEARSLEKINPGKAVLFYRKAMQILKEIDQDSRHTHKYRATWRYVRHPINRLTLVLERQERYKECLEEIEEYEKSQDILGLYERDSKSLSSPCVMDFQV